MAENTGQCDRATGSGSSSTAILTYILTLYFEGEPRMTAEEKKIIREALINYTIAIQDDLTQNEHTSEEIQDAFRAWNLTERLIEKFSK